MANSKKVEKMTPADYKPTFGELYKALPEPPKAPKQAFVEEIASLCKCSQQTVRMWIQGTQRPDALKRSLIAERLGYSEEQLFPTPVCEQ
ncbi:MAG: helix-turn-helix domain-containing protein [Muribaculaceae bacterium]|nr:helix-turn-helix domain-containing protein [Muribaculaceae bacterium]MCM1220963.1 helix-turn-helix domain-containing protein [Lachnospiraceae bacterium]MCM1532765.1 helix-turn-helix domain-containing protein [Ruminococcus flavefaciens]